MRAHRNAENTITSIANDALKRAASAPMNAERWLANSEWALPRFQRQRSLA
jgi:hypothetical protein